MLYLYNTLSKQLENPGESGSQTNLYTCGPTIYNYAHIGNLRSYVSADLLFRALKYLDLKPKWVMNLTDIDDKTIRGTLEKYGPHAGVQELYDFTEEYKQAFLSDLKEMNISAGEIEIIRVTDKMPAIQNFIVLLIEKGYAYEAEDGVYFSIEKYQKNFGDYGQLVGEKFLEGKKIGARVLVDEYEKDNLSDFVLWKHHKPEADGNIFWDHPTLKKGRPGWHIECSVLNFEAFKGQPTDIHTGGVDLIFPHHTNEIAQSQPFYKPFSKIWYHSEHLLVDGKKMAKSFHNFYTLGDLKAKGFSGQDLRYFFLTAGTHTQQNFTWEALQAAKTAREKLLALPQRHSLMPEFVSAVNDNLNWPLALAVLWNQGETSQQALEILGLKKTSEKTKPISDQVKKLLKQRQEARDKKDFQKSDQLRTEIENLGFNLSDTKDGQIIK